MKTTMPGSVALRFLLFLSIAMPGTGRAQTVSGYVLSTGGVPIPGVAVVATRVSPAQHLTNITDSVGHYSITASPNSTYTVAPNKAGYAFTPASTNLTYSAFGFENYTANFSTPATAPTANVLGSQPAIIIDPLTATLVGFSNPDGTNTVTYFEYGLTTSYGKFSITNNIGSGLASVAISNTITGLISGTNYHVQLIASNQFGVTLSGDVIFTMPPGIPAVTTLAASNVIGSNATLNGAVIPYNFATSAWFQWGISNNPYSNQTIPVILNGTNNALAFSNNLTGLTPGVVYHYRALSTNSAGATNGNDVLFGSAPVVTLFGPSIITNECHTLFVDPGATNAAGLPVVVTGSVNTNSPGNYLLTYNATNSLGGSGTTTRTVKVVDTTGPVISILGANPFYVAVNTSYSDLGATALDACGGSFAVTTNGTVNLAMPGTYPITYSSTDSFGNIGSAVRTVVVRPRQMVTTTGDSGSGSLRQVVSNSVPNDYVQFATNLSGGTIYLTTGLIAWSNNLTVDASTLPQGIIINGSQNGGIFQIAGGTNLLMGIAFENGSAGVNATNGHGGAISNGASLTIINCNFTGNTKINYAGAAVGNLGVLTVSNCNFTGNLAVGGVGGAIYNLNTATINDSLLVNNVSGETSGFGGGAIYNGGTLTLNRCTLTGNSVINYAGGGAIFNDQQAILSINQCTLSGNAADGYISGENADGSEISAGGDGGAIYIYKSSVTVNQSTFFGNHADTSYDGGGAIMNDSGFFSINQSTIVGNHANNTGHSTVNYQNGGGGLWAISTGIFSILTNSIVAGNSATLNRAPACNRARMGGSWSSPNGKITLMGSTCVMTTNAVASVGVT